ncbi:MAG TPA: methyltransferase domain-containing protein, partial [Gemmatimonadaceae bacterium]|nr:methyltransferase domain-containing protein [Gemmatimonadaceae bacterium]
MSTSGSSAFHAFEHDGWERAATVYADDAGGFVSVTAQAAEPLLDAAGVRAGERVLDLATGPGHVAAAAARRGAVVTGVDFAAAMVAIARQRHAGVPDLDFVE